LIGRFQTPTLCKRAMMLMLGALAPIALGATASPEAGTDPVRDWALDFESGVLWHVGGSASPLDYVLQPQILSIKSPAQIDLPVAGGDLVLRSRFSLLAEPIVQGPEHHYFGLSASGLIEWWDTHRGRCVFFSSGGGFGELDSKGYEIAGAQGQEFNFNWFAYSGARFRCADKLSASVGLYFQHISNGHFNKVDPGITALGPMASLGWRF
jgi:hypothetical protein